MKEPIYKFQRNMLRGQSLHIHKKQKTTSFKKHWHNYYEIIYYENCEGYCDLNGASYDIRGNCLFLLTPKDFHQIVTQDKADAVSYIFSFSEGIPDKAIQSSLAAGPLVLYDVEDWITRQIRQLYAIFTGDTPHRALKLQHLFNSLLADILEAGTPVSATGEIHPYILESISSMLEDPAKKHSLASFSQRFGITPTYFSHLFHLYTGVRFKEYLTALRIECAKRMLEDGQLPVIDVGYECGFGSPSQFVRSFQLAEGMPPSAYRKTHKK